MKIDFIKRSVREDVSAIERLPRLLNETNEFYSFDFIKKSNYILYMQDRADWQKNCLIPWAAFKELAAKFSKVCFFPSTMLDGFSSLYFLNLWGLSKGVYHFTDDLLKILPELDLQSKIPGEALLNLPEWCVYIETNDLDIQGFKPYGIFVSLNHYSQEGFFYKIGVDLQHQILNFDLPLNSDMTYRAALEDEMSVRVTREQFGLKAKDYQEVDLEAFLGDLLRYVIPKVQYLCSRNRDLKNITRPQQPIRRTTFACKGKKLLLEPNRYCSVILVGGNLQGTIEDHEDVRILFDQTMEGGFEAVHSRLKSSVDKLNEEFNSIDLLKQIRRSISALQSQVESLKASILKLERDNTQLLEEGIKYHDKLVEANSKSNEDAKNLQALESEYWEALSQIDALKSSLKAQSKSFSKNTVTGNNSKDTTIIEIVSKMVCEGQDLSPIESLQLVKELCPERVVILEEAWNSAKEIESTFKSRSKLTRDLVLLITDFFDSYIQGGDNLARKVFGNRYSAQESDSVMNSKLRKYRNFSGYEMTSHLSIGYSERLYFMIDNKSRKVIIGYCGKHLPISSR